MSTHLTVAGYRTPGFVAAYVVRSPEQVDASFDERELTPVALYVPTFCSLVLVGLWMSYRKEHRLKKEQATSGGDGTVATETTGLLPTASKDRRRSSVATLNQAFSRQSVVNSRISADVMGIAAPPTLDEQKMEALLRQDMDEWLALAELDYDDEEGTK